MLQAIHVLDFCRFRVNPIDHVIVRQLGKSLLVFRAQQALQDRHASRDHSDSTSQNRCETWSVRWV